uniref:Uncharacterized protein n=1 Tax=Anguilla anguilla TaxID=7936 RepID=A0A0E9T5C8_ANGAN
MNNILPVVGEAYISMMTTTQQNSHC